MSQDALGNKIIVGKLYGYARSTNGINSVIIGHAEKVTDKGNLTLKVLLRKGGAYSKSTPVEFKNSTASVKSVLVFPVNEAEIQ
jgi:hypothetical protein